MVSFPPGATNLTVSHFGMSCPYCDRKIIFMVLKLRSSKLEICYKTNIVPFDRMFIQRCAVWWLLLPDWGRGEELWCCIWWLQAEGRIPGYYQVARWTKLHSSNYNKFHQLIDFNLPFSSAHPIFVFLTMSFHSTIIFLN